MILEERLKEDAFVAAGSGRLGWRGTLGEMLG
jgi:hypothetical protein